MPAANCLHKDENIHPFQFTLLCGAGGLRVGVPEHMDQNCRDLPNMAFEALRT